MAFFLLAVDEDWFEEMARMSRDFSVGRLLLNYEGLGGYCFGRGFESRMLDRTLDVDPIAFWAAIEWRRALYCLSTWIIRPRS